MNLKKILLILLVLLTCISCDQISLLTTPTKKAILKSSPLEKKAKAQFWEILHEGNYANIDPTINLLTAAYLENPHDPKLAGFLGFAHLWKIAERQRLNNSDATLVDHIVLAKKYFGDAVELAPKDARLRGFYGDALLIQGKLFDSQRDQTQGYFVLTEAIKAWPEFNNFAGGYVLSSLPAHSLLYNRGLEWQWRTLDLCAGDKVDRNNPSIKIYMGKETQTGSKRACWNSWIAPHNFAGFFLNMGDMLVKNGDWQRAIKIYENAKLERNYNQWKFREVLESRQREARANVARFNATRRLQDPLLEPTTMFQSKFSCVACHQQ